MTWEVANEPRAWEGVEAGAGFDPFVKWCDETCGYIKSLDPHRLVTLGSEGAVGCCDRLDIFELAHSSPHIDYTTAHIWPKNRGWFRDDTWKTDLAPSIQKAMDYLHAHESVSRRLSRPLVIEEFGLSRDAGECTVESATTARDEFFRTIFHAIMQAPPESALAGFNFWSWGGYGRAATNTTRAFTDGPEDFKWRQGDEWLGDPPEEAQGLNSIFDVDLSTLEIIRQTSRDAFCATNVMADPGTDERREHSELAEMSDGGHASWENT
jgi:mannan endo-1,4-beta-mannosidase